MKFDTIRVIMRVSREGWSMIYCSFDVAQEVKLFEIDTLIWSGTFGEKVSDYFLDVMASRSYVDDYAIDCSKF